MKPSTYFYGSHFHRDERGGVAVIAALFFTVLAGVCALTIQSSQLYVEKLQGQRTADLATLAAAVTSSPIVGGQPSTTAIATAQNIATINGFGGSTTSMTTVNGGANLATSITTTTSLVFNSLLGGASSVNVLTSSTAKPGPSYTLGCLASLSGVVNVSSSGNAQAPGCDVVAATNLTVSSATVQVNAITVGVSATTEAGYITSPVALSPSQSNFTNNATVTDTLASSTAITTLKSNLAAMSSWPYPTTPPVAAATTMPGSGTITINAGYSGPVPQSAHITTITRSSAATLTFDGSGSADNACASPTTIKGATNLTGSPTLIFKSGCYIFGGAINNNDAGNVTFQLAPSATVTFEFVGGVTNTLWGNIVMPAATYSIAGPILNENGGSITLGAGNKAIGGTTSDPSGYVIYNAWGFVTLGNGNLYINGGNNKNAISQGTGTMTFGNGTAYFYNVVVTNGIAGTMGFGTGPYYIYNSTINSGDGTTAGAYPYTYFDGGPFYLYNSNFNLNMLSATNIGSGDMDFYDSNFNVEGVELTLGWNGSTSSGSSTLYFNGGGLTFSNGAIYGNGVTIAQASGNMNLSGGAFDVVAPIGSNPSSGQQNILIYNEGGNINLDLPSGTTSYPSGVLYAPGNSISIYNSQTMTAAGGGGCLEAVAGTLNIYTSATVNAVACTGLTITATKSSGAELVQ